MARPPASPGPPPAHYRPPGTPPPAPPMLLGQPLGPKTTPPRANSGTTLSSGAVITIAIVTLVLGLVAGFFIGRVTSSSDESSASAASSPGIADPPTSRPPGDTIPQDAPAPTGPVDSSPSTELEPTVLGKPDAPIPVGQGYIVGDVQITVEDVDPDAETTLTEYSASNPAAPDGQQHVLVSVTVAYIGPGRPITTEYLSFSLASTDQQWRDIEADCGLVPDSLTAGLFLAEGESATGNACFTIPSTAIGDELFLTTDGYDGPVYFALPSR